MNRYESSPIDPSLPHENVRQIVRLLAYLAVLPASLNEKRSALIAGIVEQIDADAWIWGISQHSESGQQPEYTCIVREGSSTPSYLTP